MPANGIARPGHHDAEDDCDRDHHQQVGQHAVGRQPLVAGHGHDHRIRTGAQGTQFPGAGGRGGRNGPEMAGGRSKAFRERRQPAASLS
jgi:hypothetical protein